MLYQFCLSFQEPAFSFINLSYCFLHLYLFLFWYLWFLSFYKLCVCSSFSSCFTCKARGCLYEICFQRKGCIAINFPLGTVFAVFHRFWMVVVLLSLCLLLLLLLSRFSRVQLCVTPERAAHPAPRPWDSPGKNTGVGCYFLLQWVKVKSESEVAQSCLTSSDPMDCSPPGSSIHGIFQARVLEWGAIAFSHLCLGIF